MNRMSSTDLLVDIKSHRHRQMNHSWLPTQVHKQICCFSNKQYINRIKQHACNCLLLIKVQKQCHLFIASMHLFIRWEIQSLHFCRFSLLLY